MGSLHVFTLSLTSVHYLFYIKVDAQRIELTKLPNLDPDDL